MANMLKRFARVLGCSMMVALAASTSHAAPKPPTASADAHDNRDFRNARDRGEGRDPRLREVPDPLRPFIPWVLRDVQDWQCPFLDGITPKEAPCSWPSTLSLELEGKGGTFRQRWLASREAWVPLPGDDKRWPEHVTVDGKSVPVVLREEAPSVLLAAGEHAVKGAFVWDTLPEALHIAPSVGLLSVTVNGSAVAANRKDGQLWLQKDEEEEAEENRLDVVVHRKITDEVPLLLTTRIELRISGKSREIVLGKGLPAGFVPMSLTTPLPARLEGDGRLRVQARPGSYVFELVAQSSTPRASIAFPSPEGPWTPQEVWVFEARNALRVVSVEGAPAVDPQQTTLPASWKALPAYALQEGGTLQLVERRRGDADPPPDELTLHRNIWLDFDGNGYTVEDRLRGTVHRNWRLEMQAPAALGRVTAGGQDQLLTRLTADGPEGFEVRQGTVDVSAESRLPTTHGHLPAVSWDRDFRSLSATLRLPPGYRLFGAMGVDQVSQSWMNRWTLLDFFLVLVIALSFGKLWGRGWGALALLAMALTFPEEDSPQWAWLALLIGEALARVVSAGRLRGVVLWYRWGSRLALTFLLIPFLVTQVRRATYPALERTETSLLPERSLDSGEAKDADGRQEEAASAEAPAAPPAQAAPGAQGGRKAQAVPAESPAAKEGDGTEKHAAAVPKTVIGLSGMGSSGMGLSYGAGSGSSAPVPTRRLEQVDPQALVQTGHGIPRWHWHEVTLSFSGPVDRNQTIGLVLIGPLGNWMLTWIRVALLSVLLLCVFDFPGGSKRWLSRSPRRAGRVPKAAVAGPLALIVATLSTAARADIPSGDLLDELRAHLTENPSCFPSCVSATRMSLRTTPRSLLLRMEVQAAARTAVLLPAEPSQWVPSEVTVDDARESFVRLSEGGKLWVTVSPGIHQISLEGELPARETISLPLPLRPHRVTAEGTGFTVVGIHDDGQVDSSLQLTRIHANDGSAPLQMGNLPPLLRVERTLTLGLSWEVETHVIRVTPKGAPILLDVPLLAGESVTSAGVRTESNHVAVSLSSQEAETSWQSALAVSNEIQLVAARSSELTEVWRLLASPIWHVERGGIPPIHVEQPGQANAPEWRPWPGERVILAMSRPPAVPGQTLTIDHATLSLSPGARGTDGTLKFSARSSRGGQHAITLPSGAELLHMSAQGVAQPIRQEGGKVIVPLVPGATEFELAFRDPSAMSLSYSAPPVDLGVPAVNVELDVSPSPDRWILFLWGPRLGPAVLFWTLLIVLFLLSLALGLTRWTPLRTVGWMLLGMGLSQVDLALAALVAGWLFALEARRRYPPARARLHNFAQVVLLLWTLVSLSVLVMSVRQGLLGEPEMQIAGNGSTRSHLQWFADRVPGLLPRPTIVSVPLLFYRACMLAWALWLSLSLIAWLRWGWESFTHGGMWRASPPKPAGTPRGPTPPASPQGPLPQRVGDAPEVR